MSEKEGGSRALVLGGGGPVGRGWEIGMLLGLQQVLAARNESLAKADVVVGTSCGAIVGAQLLLDRDLEACLGPPPSQTAANSSVTTNDSSEDSKPDLLSEFNEVRRRAATSADPDAAYKDIGQLALSTISTLPSERDYVTDKRFAPFANRAWPHGLVITSTSAQTGKLCSWSASSDVPLHKVIASSTALAGAFPPVQVDKSSPEQHMDGGVRSMLNAHLAAGHQRILIISCFPVYRHGARDRDPLAAQLIEEIASLGSACIEVIEPDDEFQATLAHRMLDFSKVHAAFHLGRRQAEQEAVRVARLWAAN